MTIFADISKQVELGPHMAAIPNAAVARNLRLQCWAGNVQAIAQVLTINRFALGPETPDQVEAIKVIVDALRIGRAVLEGKQVQSHMHVTIALKTILSKPDSELIGMLTLDGKPLLPEQARVTAEHFLAKGLKYLPTCDHVDAEGKCDGHWEIVEDEKESTHPEAQP